MDRPLWLSKSVNLGLKLGGWYFSPIFLNTITLTVKKPALYVGNHTIYGLTDSPLLWDYLQQKHDIYLRALGDKIHFKIPVWRTLLEQHGAIEGTRENCHQLMQQGESILVFPGGAREVFKRKNEAHQLIWKARIGFARMAIEHGYDIVPFAALGGDNCFDIVMDADDLQKNRISNWVLHQLKLTDKIRGGELLPTISTGIAKLPIPKPEKMYFSFGERITTQHLMSTDQNAWQIREVVAQSITQQLVELEQYRQYDRKENWSWIRKKLTNA